MPVSTMFNPAKALKFKDGDVKHFPKSLKESNKLYKQSVDRARSFLCGTHAVWPAQHAHPLVHIALLDPYINLSIQLSYLAGNYENGTESSLGALDIANPLLPLSLATLAIYYKIERAADRAENRKENSDDNKDEHLYRFLKVVQWAWIICIQAPLDIAASLTTFFWDLAKLAITYVVVPTTSVLWYPIELLALKVSDWKSGYSASHEDSAYQDMTDYAESPWDHGEEVIYTQ